MQIEKVKLSELISPDWNPRQITTDEMEKLKTSLKEFGYVSPIIVNKHNNHVVGGNQRLQALKELGYKEIEVIYINEPDISKEKALNVRLNKLSGDWDRPKLEAIFSDLNDTGFNTELTGFTNTNLGGFTQTTIEPTTYSEPYTEYSPTTDTEEIIDDYIIPEDEPEFDESIADDIEVITCPRCGYELPKH